MTGEEWLSTREAAARLGLHPHYLRRLLARGRLPGAVREDTPRGPVWRIPESAVAGYVAPPRGRPKRKEG
ncbi:MAG TPA: helix-turn-helix domain-containing protein [Gemmatimonadaceae bacterium]